MLIFFTILHVLLCVFMVFVILLQPGRDAGMGAALGGGAATSAFGGRGAVTFLSKVTAVCAGLFFLTSLGLSFVGMKTSVVGEEEPVQAAKPPPPANATEGAKPEGAATTPATAAGIEQPPGQTQPAEQSSPPTPAAPGAPAEPSGAAPAPAAPAEQNK